MPSREAEGGVSCSSAKGLSQNLLASIGLAKSLQNMHTRT